MAAQRKSSSLIIMRILRSRRGRLFRDGQEKGDPLTLVRFCPDLSPVPVGKLSDDGQAEAASVDSVRSLMSLEELEEPFSVLLLHADSVVMHREGVEIPILFIFDSNLCQPLPTVLECVVDTILKEPYQGRSVGLDLHRAKKAQSTECSALGEPVRIHSGRDP